MEFLSKTLQKDPEYGTLLQAVSQNRLPAVCTGLSSVHKAALAAALSAHTGRKIALITHTEASANELKDDLTCMGVDCLNFPSRDYCIGPLAGYSKEYEQKRIDTLSKVLGGDFAVVTVSLDAAVQLTVPPEILQNASFTLRTGDTVDLTDLTKHLVGAGYVREELCSAKGQFSVRGGILDLYPVSSKNPVRIELWGDEIDSIAYFDAETQRRIEDINTIAVTPACEVLYDPAALLERLKAIPQTKDGKKTVIESDIEALSSGASIAPDRYLPLIYQNKEPVFDYLSDCLILLSESAEMTERFRSMELSHAADVEQYLEEGFLIKETADLWMDKTEFFRKAENAVILENFPRGAYEMPLKELMHFNWKRSTAWSGDMTVLKEDIDFALKKRGAVVILAGEARAAKILREELEENGIFAAFCETHSFTPAGVTVTTGGLSGGMEIPGASFLLITHRHIVSDTKKRHKHAKSGKEIGSLDELHKGDYVVHEAHGIGIFDGIDRITSAGVTKDYIKIKYMGSDVLYVPVTQLDLVSKYIGAPESGTLRLNRLGGAEWQKTRKRVKAAVRDMAKQLTELYAKRMSARGYAFSEDTDLQSDFERRFPYDETEDQLRCVNEIKGDMERAVPMDRLLCGDVGFGKTEVALRAAFKCVSEGKQCALLVPTTILAYQHYNTIVKRFGEMPVSVGLLNRFVSPARQKKVLTDLKSGRLDMVVGTHRLISEDIAFHDIGLVIIDEEQRFGVAQKEKFKEKYPSVDILTLSATPIPRTLNMAMSGLRDMSSIDEAPGDRHPVQTYVLEYNEGVILDAIRKEARRGGQIYYLHNRVETITRVAANLQAKLPELAVGVAHGKMSERELTDIWHKLMEHEIDLLVCTTIIETGIDVPNVNTLILDEADKMGLAQLHQLRGRVGRSPRRAYAYFCFRRGRQLSETAAKRLEAIREFTEFGSGFKIALRDLEIRGAGSILGAEQHGNMESVGYDMYLKLLSEAVKEESGTVTVEEPLCTVDLNISAHIPESYIASLPARLGIYKRIAAAQNDEDASDVIDELCDRFGEPPAVVLGLLDISILRSKAAASGIYEIVEKGKTLLLRMTDIREDVMEKLTAAFGDRFALNAAAVPVYVLRIPKGEKLTETVKLLAKAL